MKKLFFHFLVSAILLSSPLFAEERWSTYQGRMSWEDANQRCKSLGMRLPTLDEFKRAYYTGISKPWEKDGLYYWSSSPYNSEKYYEFGIYSGDTNPYSSTLSSNVQCYLSLPTSYESEAPSSFQTVRSAWSPYQGFLSWNQAYSRCRSLGMRLPTIEELRAAYTSGVTKSWERDGLYYWSSTPYDSVRFYELNIRNGNTYSSVRNVNDYVRCYR